MLSPAANWFFQLRSAYECSCRSHDATRALLFSSFISSFLPSFFLLTPQINPLLCRSCNANLVSGAIHRSLPLDRRSRIMYSDSEPEGGRKEGSVRCFAWEMSVRWRSFAATRARPLLFDCTLLFVTCNVFSTCLCAADGIDKNNNHLQNTSSFLKRLLFS